MNRLLQKDEVLCFRTNGLSNELETLDEGENVDPAEGPQQGSIAPLLRSMTVIYLESGEADLGKMVLEKWEHLSEADERS